MSKYTVVSELIKIANTLDKNGYIKEANTIDQLTKKIVTSSVDEATYKKDIENYRNLIKSSKTAPTEEAKQQFLQQATNQYNGVLNSMWSRYSPEQKQAWMAQSNRIRNEFLVGDGTPAAPGYAAAPGFLTKKAQNFIDERVMNLQPKIDDYINKLSESDKKNKGDLVNKQFFQPIIDQMLKNKLLNQYSQDYLRRTFSILMAKHGSSMQPDKPAWDF